MSTTNPPAGPNNPGGDAPHPAPGAGPQWPRDVTHGRAPDEHGGGGGVNPASVAAGHEPDAFYVAPIMSIPLAVVVAFVIAFVVAAGAFAFYAAQARRPVPFAHPEAVKQGEEPTNQRLERLDRSGLWPHEKNAVDQPRLEPLRRYEADGMFYARPPLPTGNSPEIHADDIRPDRVPALQTTGLNPDKHTAHIPIAEAMKLAAEQKGMFPVQKVPSKVVVTAERPSASSGGAGVVPPLPDEGEKQGAGKTDAGKKDEGKKEAAPAPKQPPKQPEKK